MRLPQWTGYGVALGAMLLIGCTANMAGTGTAPVKGSGFSLFDNPHGYGSLVMRVVDQRPGYGVQAIAQADPYDEVQIRLGGSKITPRLATMSAVANHQYQSNALGMLPPGNDYNLIVSLASRSVTLGSPVLVGQGGVEGINVAPGSTRSVTVVINTVGDIMLQADDYVVAHGSPEVSELYQQFGFPEVLATSVITAQASFSQDPAAPERQKINATRLQVTDSDGNILFQPNGQQLASGSIRNEILATGKTYRAFTVPNISGNEGIAWITIFGLNYDPTTDTERVISTKTRGFLILKGATLSVDLSPTIP